MYKIRRHNLKLVNTRYHYDLRKYCYTARIINTGTWNNLGAYSNLLSQLGLMLQIVRLGKF